MAKTKGKPKVAKDGTFGFDEWHDLTDPARIGAEFARLLPVAHRRVGLLFVKEATKTITTDKPFAANAALTQLLKGSSTPLVDNGDLVGSLGYQVVDLGTVRLGVSSPQLSSGRYLYEVLHNGASIPKDKWPKVRRAVFAKLRKKLGPKKFQLTTATWPAPEPDAWETPARPFLTAVFTDKAWLERAMDVYRELVRAVFDAQNEEPKGA